jgi:hypothetical protein
VPGPKTPAAINQSRRFDVATQHFTASCALAIGRAAKIPVNSHSIDNSERLGIQSLSADYGKRDNLIRNPQN